VAAGCWGKALPPVALPVYASDAPEKAMEQYDTNKDGVLDAAELAKVPGLAAAFPGAKGVSTADIRARIDRWNEQNVAVRRIIVRVYHNGRPLVGATVTFVPESFLGPGLKTATGTTVAEGVASLSVPVSGPADSPGVAPGFYRVQITMQGENIPARYNSETTLGEEVASDSRYTTGIKYDLNY
jgi:hypothetical protein